MTPPTVAPDSAIRSRPRFGSDQPYARDPRHPSYRSPRYPSGDTVPIPIRLVGINVVSLAVAGPLDAQHLIPLRHRIHQLGAAGYRTINVDVDTADNADTAMVVDALRSIQDDAARSSITITINGGIAATARP